jgi:hypothetical protein
MYFLKTSINTDQWRTWQLLNTLFKVQPSQRTDTSQDTFYTNAWHVCTVTSLSDSIYTVSRSTFLVESVRSSRNTWNVTTVRKAVTGMCLRPTDTQRRAHMLNRRLPHYRQVATITIRLHTEAPRFIRKAFILKNVLNLRTVVSGFWTSMRCHHKK